MDLSSEFVNLREQFSLSFGLVRRALHDLRLDRVCAEEAEDENGLRLSDPMRAVLRLEIGLRVL